MYIYSHTTLNALNLFFQTQVDKFICFNRIFSVLLLKSLSQIAIFLLSVLSCTVLCILNMLIPCNVIQYGIIIIYDIGVYFD